MPYNLRTNTQIQKKISLFQHRRQILSTKRRKNNKSHFKRTLGHQIKIKTIHQKKILSKQHQKFTKEKLINFTKKKSAKTTNTSKLDNIQLLPPFDQIFLSRNPQNEILELDNILDGLGTSY